jgi:hypothetical protein
VGFTVRSSVVNPSFELNPVRDAEGDLIELSYCDVQTAGMRRWLPLDEFMT